MTRHMLIRSGGGPAQVVAEAALPTEAELHEALTKHPALIPTSDMELGRTVVVGRESGLSAGYADLVLLDDKGQLCIVEVKNEGNPDTRRVVAQLLDYAASLWSLSVDEFEQRVLHPFLIASGHSGLLPTIGEYIVDSVGNESDDPASVNDLVGRGLSSGEFALVVAAPQIPVGVQRVLEYLNARGQRLYGLEVSYFSGPVECFVPRLVVKPLASDPAGDRGGGGDVLDHDSFIARVPEDVREDVTTFLGTCSEAGADVVWRKYGPSINVTRDQQRQVAYLEPKRLGVTLKTSGTFPRESFDETRRALDDLGVGTVTKDGWYRVVALADVGGNELAQVMELVRAHIARLSPSVQFSQLPAPVEVTFERNDHNIWERHVPALVDFHGQYLRGRLTHVATKRESDIELLPLANNQPGWRPRFLPASARDDLWPAASTGDKFTLVVDAVSRTSDE